MDQVPDYADDRLINGCIYCGGLEETKDHAPSRVFLDEPYPTNLPSVWACLGCNNSLGRDEEYVAALIESVIAGACSPERIRRPKIAKLLSHSPALQARISATQTSVGGRTAFLPEGQRVWRVVWKLAIAHAAFDLSEPCRDREPSVFWWPLDEMHDTDRGAYEAPHFTDLYGEVGSRGMNREVVLQFTMRSPSGELASTGVSMNDWIEVQEGRYRYHAIDIARGVLVKIVISEYLACQVLWEH